VLYSLYLALLYSTLLYFTLLYSYSSNAQFMYLLLPYPPATARPYILAMHAFLA